jgi:hypothetical protein
MTGAVWIVGDGDGRRSSAFDYAKALMEEHGGDLQVLIRQLAGYGESVAVQVASLLAEQGTLLSDPEITTALQHAGSSTRRGFQAYREAREERAGIE